MSMQRCIRKRVFNKTTGWTGAGTEDTEDTAVENWGEIIGWGYDIQNDGVSATMAVSASWVDPSDSNRVWSLRNYGGNELITLGATATASRITRLLYFPDSVVGTLILPSAQEPPTYTNVSITGDTTNFQPHDRQYHNQTYTEGPNEGGGVLRIGVTPGTAVGATTEAVVWLLMREGIS